MSQSRTLEGIDEYDDLLDDTEHRWRSRLIGLAALVALVAVGAYALWAMVLAGGSSTAEETQTATVERGSIVTTLSITGVAAAQSTANLSFSQPGTVSVVNVTLGQEVKQGDVLAEIDSDALERAVTTAEVNLASAQLKLTQVLNGADEAEIASDEQKVAQAQADLDQANSALQELEDGPSASEVLSAQEGVASAESKVAQAESSLAQLESSGNASSEDIAAADAAIAAAQLSLDVANANLAQLQQGSTQSELETTQGKVDTAAASLAAAEAQLNDLLDGEDPEDIEQQRNQVRLAELSLEKAQEDLEMAQLVAPFDGTVAALNVEVGEEVGAGGGTGSEAAIILNTPDAFRLDLTITESDMPDIEAGQVGFASFDAIEGGMFPFVIDSIGTNPTTTQGVVTYEARASVQTEQDPDAMRELLGGALGGRASSQAGAADEGAIPADGAGRPGGIADTSATPLPGMNASLTIIVDQAQDVLMVPASAIQSEGFESVVEVLGDDGSTEKVVVQTGLTDGTNTEITEGLEEGQTVIVPSGTATSQQATTGTEFPQDGFRPGGFGPGGGAQ